MNKQNIEVIQLCYLTWTQICSNSTEQGKVLFIQLNELWKQGSLVGSTAAS